jgi:hypothetical protein
MVPSLAVRDLTFIAGLDRAINPKGMDPRSSPREGDEEHLDTL